MSTECLLPLVLGEAADEEMELAYVPGLLEFLMSPAPSGAQSLEEGVKDYELKATPDRRSPNSASTLKNWLAQILLD